VEGTIKGVVVQTERGSVPKVGGKILPGRWPGKVGAAKKALLNQEKQVRGISQLQYEEMQAELTYLRAKVAREKAQKSASTAPKPERHAANTRIQTKARNEAAPGITWGQLKAAKRVCQGRHGVDLRPSEFKAKVNGILGELFNCPAYYA
jgi:ribosomal protein L29